LSISDTLPTTAEIEEAALNYFQVAHMDPVTGKSPPLGPRSFLGQEARAIASLCSEVIAAAKAADDDAVPGGIYTDANGVTRTRNSTKALDDWAFNLGLPSNLGGYGRNGAQAARNGKGTARGVNGTVVPNNAELADSSGSVILKVPAGFTIPSEGYKLNIGVVAVTKGVAGNLLGSTVLRWTSPVPGLIATFSLSQGLTGGLDTESDLSLALRIVDLLQNPPSGGTAADFRRWAEATQNSDGDLVGITRAYVYPKRDGTGTVTVVPTISGTDPGSTIAGQVQTWLDALKIETDTVFVRRPYYISGEKLTINLRVRESTKFPFDWSNTLLGVEYAMPIVSGTSGTTSLVVDSSNISPDFNARASSGKLRIAFVIPSVSPLPIIRTVTAYATATPMAGQATLTLNSALPADAVADTEVNPVSDATLTVARAVLAYANSLGPSRVSGYADARDFWEDRVTIGRIAESALAARDPETNERVLLWSPLVGNPAGTTYPGVTIAVGANAENTNDYVLRDNRLVNQGPQMVQVAAINIRRAER